MKVDFYHTVPMAPFDYTFDESLYQPRISIEDFGPPLRSLSDVPSKDGDKWDPRYLSPTTLDLIAPWPILGTEAPLVEGSFELKQHTESKGYEYESTLYALNHEVQHIVRLVHHMRFARDGSTAEWSHVDDDSLIQKFHSGADIIRKDDFDLWALAEMGRLSDHLDTMDFFIERFAKYRLRKRANKSRAKRDEAEECKADV